MGERGSNPHPAIGHVSLSLLLAYLTGLLYGENEGKNHLCTPQLLEGRVGFKCNKYITNFVWHFYFLTHDEVLSSERMGAGGVKINRSNRHEIQKFSKGREEEEGRGKGCWYCSYDGKTPV